MAQRIQNKRSSLIGKRPDRRYLEPGELALNTNSASPGAFLEVNDGSIIKIGPAHLGEFAPPLVQSAQFGIGEMWVDNSEAEIYNETGDIVLHVWDGSRWLNIGGNHFKNNVIIDGDLHVHGDTILGDGCEESNTHINSELTVHCDSHLDGNVNLNPNVPNYCESGFETHVWGTLNAHCDVNLDGGCDKTTTIGTKLQTTCEVVIGEDTDCESDYDFTVNQTAFFNCPVFFNSDDVTLGRGCEESNIYINGYLTLECGATLGSGCSDNIQLNAETDVLCRLICHDVVEFEAPVKGHFVPIGNCAYDLGSPDSRWREIYTCDLNLQNERGDWKIVEEHDYLSIRNNKTGKLFKFVLEEIEE